MKTRTKLSNAHLIVPNHLKLLNLSQSTKSKLNFSEVTIYKLIGFCNFYVFIFTQKSKHETSN